MVSVPRGVSVAVLRRGGVPGGVPVGVLGHGGVPGPVLEGDLGDVGEMVLERTDRVSPVEVYMVLGVVRVDKLVVFKLLLIEVGKVSLV